MNTDRPLFEHKVWVRISFLSLEQLFESQNNGGVASVPI